MGKDKQGGEVPSQFKSKEILWTSKSEHMTFVHFLIGLRSNVILSVAKNLSERPFVALRVTTLCANLLWSALAESEVEVSVHFASESTV